MEEKIGLSHKIVLHNRDKGNLTGILDVISFDENTIVLDTDMGLLTIKGKDLHVSRLTLDKGEIDIEGKTDSFVYSSNESYRKAAEGVEERLEAILKSFDGVDHDAGFQFLLSAVADYRVTGSKEAHRRGLHAANMLAGRYNPAGRFIRAWNDGTAEAETTAEWMNVSANDKMQENAEEKM